MLKTDLHIHTSEDWYDCDNVSYSAKQLIQEAARQKFEVLAITHHNHVFFNREIQGYAKKKGILLISGAEARIERADVLLINVTNKDLPRLKRLGDLEKIKDRALIIAPHPYFFLGNCLGDKLEPNIRHFHAIEYSHFYNKFMQNRLLSFLNGNKKAEEVARKYNKPIIGTSDAHRMYCFGTTFSWVDSAKTKDAVLEAVKKGKVRLETHPLPLHSFARRIAGVVVKERFWRLLTRTDFNSPDTCDDPHFKTFK
ncbi:PHP domain-containing protein [Candidatus Woesearchaeota archaeon]|nr:PHP domain-containing protein [Candidatus Woesearchaeota archaeon]